MKKFEKNNYIVDFENNEKLTTKDKEELKEIQEKYYPIERTEHLTEFYLDGKITDDEYETLTTVPFQDCDE